MYRFTNNLNKAIMDLSKVNPILGYEMYTNRDRSLMAQRSAYGVNIPYRKINKIDRDV